MERRGVEVGEHLDAATLVDVGKVQRGQIESFCSQRLSASIHRGRQSAHYNPGMRLFVGIPLAETTIDELRAASARLRSSAGGLRWAPPESLHITLQFLGNTTQEQYACIVPRLRALASPPVSICLEAIDCFDRAGVLIARVRLTPELVLLQQRVTTATQPCGFVPEARPYHPHITLARNKSQRCDWRELRAKIQHQPNFTRFAASEFLLYESFLSSAGSRYEVRERFLLGQG